MPRKQEISIVYCLFPKKYNIKKIAADLLKEKLIVCANIIPAVQSIYTWNKKIESAEEVIVLFKTKPKYEKKLIVRLGKIHPYDVPFIATFCPRSVNRLYLNYLTSEI